MSQRAPVPGNGDALAPLKVAGLPVLRTWERGAIHPTLQPDRIDTRGFLDEPEVHSAGPSAIEPIPLLQGALPLGLIWSSRIPASADRWLFGLLGFMAGFVAFALMAIVEYGAWALVTPPRPRGESLADDEANSPPLTEPGEPLFVEAADGARLAGRLHPARVANATGRTVLILHGFAEASEALQALRVSALVNAGWDAVALDLRAYGQSGGTFATFGGKETDDVRVWIDALSARSGRDCPIVPVLWGRSMGAAIAVRAAASDPRIAALVLESPMVDLIDAIAVWFRRRHLPCPGLLARLVVGRAGKIARVPLDRPRPIQLAGQVRCPVLIVHGRDDMLVSGAGIRRLAAAFPDPATLIELTGAGHTDVIDIGGGTLIRQVLTFLDDAISRPKPTPQV